MHLLNDPEDLNKNTFFQNEPRVSLAQTYLCTGAQDTGVTSCNEQLGCQITYRKVKLKEREKATTVRRLAAAGATFCIRFIKTSCITYQAPGIKVHGCQLAIVWFSNMNIERLALINKSTSVSSHLDNDFLWDFPHCLVESL